MCVLVSLLWLHWLGPQAHTEYKQRQQEVFPLQLLLKTTWLPLMMRHLWAHQVSISTSELLGFVCVWVVQLFIGWITAWFFSFNLGTAVDTWLWLMFPPRFCTSGGQTYATRALLVGVSLQIPPYCQARQGHFLHLAGTHCTWYWVPKGHFYTTTQCALNMSNPCAS